MKLLSVIDKHILSYWDTAPSERIWAYLATLPVVLITINAVALLTKQASNETLKAKRIVWRYELHGKVGQGRTTLIGFIA